MANADFAENPRYGNSPLFFVQFTERESLTSFGRYLMPHWLVHFSGMTLT